jgi:putative flippase GtrA
MSDSVAEPERRALGAAVASSVFHKHKYTREFYRWRWLVGGLLWRGIGVAILLVVLWVVVRLVLGISSALIHLLLFIAALVLVYVVVKHVMARRL